MPDPVLLNTELTFYGTPWQVHSQITGKPADTTVLLPVKTISIGSSQVGGSVVLVDTVVVGVRVVGGAMVVVGVSVVDVTSQHIAMPQAMAISAHRAMSSSSELPLQLSQAPKIPPRGAAGPWKTSIPSVSFVRSEPLCIEKEQRWLNEFLSKISNSSFFWSDTMM
jgi:hypothetical protein